MKKLLLTTALIGGLVASTSAMAQDYDKKNVENLESQAGFSVLKMKSPIQQDNASGGILVKSQETKAIRTIQPNIVDVVVPVTADVNIEDIGVVSVEEQAVTIIEPASGDNADIIVETKKVIGNTDTGATVDDMTKAMGEGLN